MSINEIEQTIALRSDQLFTHSNFVLAEIKHFEDVFVRNERFKEFEGLLKTNHRLYESLQVKFDPQKTKKLNALTNQLNKLSQRLENIGVPHFTKNELDGMQLVEKPTSEIMRQAELKQREIEERWLRNELEESPTEEK